MGFTVVNDVTATVASQSNSGTTSLTVGTGLGAQFASATTANPIRCGAFDSTGALKFYFDVTGRSTDTLTVANRGAESTTDANMLTTDVVAAVITVGVATTLPLGLSVYGDGSDGTVTFDGTTTILGIAPSSNTYTLTRDLWLAAGTINSGVTIVTHGFRIFCQGTLTNNGTIQWDGANASGSAAGAATANSSSSFSNLSSIGTAGGAGGTTTGSSGSNASAGGAIGANGGHGGSGTSGNGASGSSAFAGARFLDFRTAFSAVLLKVFTDGTVNLVQGGAGGGGGGGDGTNAGGGGGGGGAVVAVYAKTFAGAGAVHARGGNGGTPSAGNCGGGGGGGGGGVIIVSGSVSGGAIAGQTIDANGGTKGNASGTGPNASIANGSNGSVYLIPN